MKVSPICHRHRKLTAFPSILSAVFICSAAAACAEVVKDDYMFAGYFCCHAAAFGYHLHKADKSTITSALVKIMDNVEDVSSAAVQMASNAAGKLAKVAVISGGKTLKKMDVEAAGAEYPKYTKSAAVKPAKRVPPPPPAQVVPVDPLAGPS